MSSDSTVAPRSRTRHAFYPITLVGLLAVMGVTGLTGCSALDVNSPTTLEREDLENPVGVELSLNGVRQQVRRAFEAAIRSTLLLTDEAGPYGNGAGMPELNARQRDPYLARIRQERGYPSDAYYYWQESYNQASIALPFIQRVAAASTRGVQIGEVFALRGFILLSLAEQICPGFPIANTEVSDNGTVVTPLYNSDPQTADSAFTRALADFDSAIVYAGAATQIGEFARLGRARALLGLGRFADAGTAAAEVPATFSYTLPTEGLHYSLSDSYWIQDREGTNGIDFVSANDPRLLVDDPYPGCETCHRAVKYMQSSNPILVFASDVEARLIEAEAQLAENPASPAWLNTLNALRATVALSDTTDPGTPEGRVDLLFRERAFWLYGTAHRLGDLRRLMAHYGRDSETLFPVGDAQFGGFLYGTLSNIPFDGEFEHRYNPKITGCTDQPN